MTFHLGWHFPAALEPVVHLGWIGVDLFFVLSGYLICLQLLRPYLRSQAPDVKDFYRRRLYRVLPAYLAVVALYFLVPMWRERSTLSPLWQFLTFTTNFFIDYVHDPAFSHVWSLCAEEHFYLLLPPLVLLLMRRPSLMRTAGVIAALVLFGVAIRTWILLHTLRPLPIDGEWDALYIERLYYPTYTRLDGLLAGVTLATIQTFRPLWWRALLRRGHTFTVIGLMLTAFAIYLFWDRFSSDTGLAAVSIVAGFPILSLGLAFLVVAAISRDGLLARIRVPGAEIVATLAFSLYLTHKEMAHLLGLAFPELEDARTWPALLAYAAACFAGATLLYLCVERPFLWLRDRKVRPIPKTADQARLDPAL